MIICRTYLSDDNELLKYAQHDSYMQNIGALFHGARAALVYADSIMGTELLIVEKAKAIDQIDHRVLQDAHDIIAAAYRHLHDDGGQLDLLHGNHDLRSRYNAEWNNWFSAEIQELVKSARFVRSVVESVVLTNSLLGPVAKRNVCDVLITHYGMEDWGFADGYVKIYAPVRA